jgi:Zn-dependent oligopeptidase
MTSSPLEQSLTADGVRRLVNQNIEHATKLRDAIASLASASDDMLTWDKTFGTFDRIADLLHEASGAPQLISMAHPDPDVRAAAQEGEPKISTFVTKLFMDAKLAHILERTAAHLNDLDRTKKKFVHEVLRDYRRNGLKLLPEKQERLRVINEKLTLCGQAFDQNLADASSSINVTREQLTGLPETYIKSHQPGASGFIRITTDNPDYVPFMQYAKDREVARELYILHKNRAKEKNLPLLDTILALREEKAHLLGYANWADYVLEPRMAKTASRVAEFLEDVRTELKPGLEHEMSVYREIARSHDLLLDGNISLSDAAYVDELATRERFAVDSQEVSAYFEIQGVIEGVLRVASTLFGIVFEDSTAPTWHPDVRVLEVIDPSGSIRGRLYLDLYPRENKYKHAAVFGLQEGLRLPDGSRREAHCALVCNFAKPGNEPSLLTHAETITLFHEFGHALHHLFSETELASVAGTNVARDFVEAPSQALEEYAWQREALDLFAKHHKTGERLPDDLYHKMLNARTFGRATDTAQQLFYAALDQAYHTRPTGFDSTTVMQELFPLYIQFAFVPDTHFQATFGHLVGYDAGYYGYQWALAIARDLLTRFEKEGLMNPDTATAYRHEVLSKGGSLDEASLVEHFLGRPFSTEAYKKFLGVH